MLKLMLKLNKLVPVPVDFPKPYEPFGRDINVKVDFNLMLKLMLKLNKLVPVSVDLSKLSDVVKNDVVKRNCT